MRPAAAGLWGVLLSVALASPLGATPRLRASLTATERRALDSGRLVAKALRFAQGDGRYVGGVSYQVVAARPELVLAALSDVKNWPDALPRTKSARLLDATGGLPRVELVQGGSFVDARYTVLIERTETDTLRFWLDPTRPHDIRDVWGFFRVQPLPGGRSLVTVGAALDLGDGIARMLFEDKIESLVLGAPLKIREFVEPRALALSP
jgi:hypothetical protein